MDDKAVRTIRAPSEIGADVPRAAAIAGIERAVAIEPHQVEIVVRQVGRDQEFAIRLKRHILRRAIDSRRGNPIAATETGIQRSVDVEAHQTDLVAAIGRVPGQDDLAVRLQDRRFGASDDASQRNAVPTPEAGIQRAIGVVARQAEVIAPAAVAVPGDEDLAVRLENGFLAELPARPEAGRGLPIPHAKGRRIVDCADRHSGVVVRTRAAVPIGQHKPHGARARRRGHPIRVLVGDVLHQCRNRRWGGIAVERDHEVTAAAATGEGPDRHAAIGDSRTAHADLARARPLVPDAEHIFGAVPAGWNGDGEGTGIEVGAVDIGHQRITALLDHHRPGAFVVAQAVAGETGDRRRIVDRRHRHTDRLRAGIARIVGDRHGEAVAAVPVRGRGIAPQACRRIDARRPVCGIGAHRKHGPVA